MSIKKSKYIAIAAATHLSAMSTGKMKDYDITVVGNDDVYKLANYKTKEAKQQSKVIYDDYPSIHSEPFVRKTKKIGRNQLCPCGSKLKSKKCCHETSS